MRVLILWTNWSGYMDACAKELQRLLGCNLDIICSMQIDNSAPFSGEEFFAYPCTPYTLDAGSLSHCERQSYDLMLVCGWHVKEYRALARSSRGRSIRVLCMDNQWVGSVRQYLGVAAFIIHLRRLYDFAFVPGYRQAKFPATSEPADKVIEGHLACADGFLHAPLVKRKRTFLFVGRLVNEKGTDELVRAWRTYISRNEVLGTSKSAVPDRCCQC